MEALADNGGGDDGCKEVSHEELAKFHTWQNQRLEPAAIKHAFELYLDRCGLEDLTTVADWDETWQQMERTIASEIGAFPWRIGLLPSTKPQTVPDAVRYTSFFAVVCTTESGEPLPVCFASSHEDARAKVNALAKEAEAFRKATHTECVYCAKEAYFYVESTGASWQSHDGVQWNDHEREPLVVDSDVLYAWPRNAWDDSEVYRKVMLGDEYQASMKAVIENHHQDEPEVQKAFLDSLRAMPVETLRLLNQIYFRGDYASMVAPAVGCACLVAC